MPYQVLFGAATLERAKHYAAALQSGAATPGARLGALIGGQHAQLDATDLLHRLLQTKQPQIFAESQVAGDGRDWNAAELHLLGDISIAADVQIFDDGGHHDPTPHRPPLPGTLIFTCGALLRNGYGVTTPDLTEVAPAGALDATAYAGLYARRLGPVFAYIQARATQRRRPALVTVPGLGCGQFAGRFQGTLGTMLQRALAQVLQSSAPQLDAIRLVRFDPFNECVDASTRFEPTELRTRPLCNSRNPHPQLCPPVAYQEQDDDFGDCDLYSLVAWDQVSWPGNDFFAGARATDDGVKAAATSSMLAITGIEGRYDPRACKYLPPAGFGTWGECVGQAGLQLELGTPFIHG